MNTEQITQLVETIKTLNLNINDATTQKIVDTIIPVVKMYLIKGYVSMFLEFLAGMIVLGIIYKIIKLAIENRPKE